MAKLSANLTWLFKELPPMDRFAAARAAGFEAVEILFPYDLPVAGVRAALRENALELVLINLPAGDMANGERGFAGRPGEEARFNEALATALQFADACGCPRVHAMSGQRIDGLPLAEHEATLVRNLANAAPLCAAAGVTLLIEPLNEHDNPGYVLSSSAQAIAVLDRVAQPNVLLQLDLYHTCMTEGDAVARAHALRGRFGHVQIAGCPGRHEPDRGDLDARQALAQLDADGYDGWIGCEYAPRASTTDGLAWAAPYLDAGAAELNAIRTLIATDAEMGNNR